MLHALLLASTSATVPDVIVFAASAVVILMGSVGVVTSSNPVHAALSLVMTLFGVAVLFIEQEADFLAAVQIIVYAGAIVVLFLFVIMLLGVDRPDRLEEPLSFQRPVALAIGALVLAEVLFLAGHRWATGAKTGRGVGIKGGAFGSNIERVARVLFTTFLWPFEITAALLVIAVVGAVVLARRSGQRPDDVPAQDQS
jgi:NADH-quinone oxidoreductase subunit J